MAIKPMQKLLANINPRLQSVKLACAGILIFGALFCFNSESYASVVFADSFETPGELLSSQWNVGSGAVIATAPDGTQALTFSTASNNNTGFYTLNSFASSTGTFTLTFDLMGNCGYTTGCGLLMYSSNATPNSFGWILADTTYSTLPKVADSLGTWEQVSYTFSGTNTNLGLMIWAGAPHAAADSIYVNNMVLTNNPTGIASGTLTVSPVSAVPLPPSVLMFASGLLVLSLYPFSKKYLSSEKR